MGFAGSRDAYCELCDALLRESRRQNITHLTIDQLRVAFLAHCNDDSVDATGNQTGEAPSISDAVQYLDAWRDEPAAHSDSSIPWRGLMQQFGGDYRHVNDFKRRAKAALRKVQAVFPGLDREHVNGRIVIRPGRTTDRAAAASPVRKTRHPFEVNPPLAASES